MNSKPIIVEESTKEFASVTANDYQDLASRTLRHAVEISPVNGAVLNCALGMVGEAGEVAELIKKHIFHETDLNLTQLKKELGDVLWYLSGLASLLGIPLADIMAHNIDKLKARYPEGFDLDRTGFKEGVAE